MKQSPAATPRQVRRAAAARIVLVLMLAAMLSGCGKKGNPSPPADEPSTYPRNYPSE